MKEVLTKSFWQGVRKTFYEALEEPPAKDGAALPPAEDKLKSSPGAEPAPPASGDQH